ISCKRKVLHSVAAVGYRDTGCGAWGISLFGGHNAVAPRCQRAELVGAIASSDRSVAAGRDRGALDRIASTTVGYYSAQKARLPRRALGELEAADAGVPDSGRSISR